jgi:hypothetical protein
MLKATMVQRLEFLAKELGLSEQEVLGKAVDAGVCALYQQRMGEKYLAGEIDRETALCVLGPQGLARVEFGARPLCECYEDSDPLACGHA